tara:strand:- start:138 stop:272 length:135 start_codon:yes stop_codon:yes gene_type:complete
LDFNLKYKIKIHGKYNIVFKYVLKKSTEGAIGKKLQSVDIKQIL